MPGARPMLAGAVIALLMHAPAFPAAAAEQWTAYSQTAESITGNVTFSADRITFGNGKSLPLAPAGTIPGFSTVGQRVEASLFRVTAPADPCC